MLSYPKMELLPLQPLLLNLLLQLKFKEGTKEFPQTQMTLHYNKGWELACPRENLVSRFGQQNIVVLKLTGLVKFTPHNNKHNSSNKQQLKP